MNTTTLNISRMIGETKSAAFQDLKSEITPQIQRLTSLVELFFQALRVTIKVLFFGCSQLIPISLNITGQLMNFAVLIGVLYLAHFPLLAYEGATKIHQFRGVEQTSEASRTKETPEKLLCLPPAQNLPSEPRVNLGKHLPLIIPQGWEKWTRKKIETEMIPMIKMKIPTFTSKKFKRKSDLIKAIQNL